MKVEVATKKLHLLFIAISTPDAAPSSGQIVVRDTGAM
ncbi:unnamed protein product [Hydatigera taeniaeformis]|uniref:Short-chain dehydrogenase n=1 Tax=Hydatigena taeniaeformis TaxID=6205 RepID=A0A0R3XD75_HYDTA|nr:unnamed protein product [Hydatigera taeniaeformis]